MKLTRSESVVTFPSLRSVNGNNYVNALDYDLNRNDHNYDDGHNASADND